MMNEPIEKSEDNKIDYQSIIEALLFASDVPLVSSKISSVLENITPQKVEEENANELQFQKPPGTDSGRNWFERQREKEVKKQLVVVW